MDDDGEEAPEREPDQPEQKRCEAGIRQQDEDGIDGNEAISRLHLMSCLKPPTPPPGTVNGWKFMATVCLKLMVPPISCP